MMRVNKLKLKLVYGWGINDVSYPITRYEVVNNKEKMVWRCPYYEDWGKIIQRCFNPKIQEIFPNYKGCTVCEEWKYLSNFIKWVENQPNRDWRNCEPDKDILIEGNKHYSPNTVVYVNQSVNSFITDSRRSRGGLMIGVTVSASKQNPYRSRCNNPFTGKCEYLGVFSTELEAHLTWKSKKQEHSSKLSELQSDIRVSKRLKEMYGLDVDLTNK